MSKKENTKASQRLAFNPNGWDYSQGETEIYQLAADLYEEFCENGSWDPVEGWQMWGGKWLGLELCQILAHKIEELRSTDQSILQMTVPAYTASTRNMAKDANYRGPNRRTLQWENPRGNLILRSSENDEDWLSGESGTNTSHKADASQLMREFYDLSKRDRPCVAQKWVAGVGMVVDVVYSHLLRKVVVKITTGRKPYKPSLSSTSATWDIDGLNGVWDPETGEEIVLTRTGVSSGTAPDMDYVALSRTLYVGLCAMGIKFGVQIELVLGDYDKKLYLVQVRPTPNQARCDPTMSFEVRENEKLFSLSGRINGPFDIRGDGVILPGERNDHLSWQGKIGVNRDKPEPWAPELDEYVEFGLKGVIMPEAFMDNSKHQTMEADPNGLNCISGAWNEIRRATKAGMGLLALPIQKTSSLWRKVRKETHQLRLISDGVIGAVYVDCQ